MSAAATGLRRGTSIGTGVSLGHDELSTLGPTPGNGFEHRWADDLAAIAEHGATAVRLTLDWSRLQPRAGALDGRWAEWFDGVLTGCRRVGLDPWVVLVEHDLPRWFDDAGGFDDPVAAGRYFPRWAERAADRFGDLVAGWIPLLTAPPEAASRWQDAWSALAGPVPVTRVVTLPDDRRLLARPVEWGDRPDWCDRSGLRVATAAARALDEDDRRRERERLGELVRQLAEEGPDLPIVLVDLVLTGDDPSAELHDAAVATAIDALTESADDGVPVELAFVPLAEGTRPAG
jgi:hypothetical protein